MNSIRYSSFLIITLLLAGLLLACGSSGGNTTSAGGSSSPSTTRQTVTIQGSIADVVSSNKEENGDFLIAKVKHIFTFVENAFAQEQVFEGILVEAFDGGTKVGEDTTDSSGEFTIENVPCGTPLTLIFTYQGSSITLEGISAPCPEMGDEGVISMVVSLNFQQDQAEADDVQDQEDIADSAINCTNDKQEIDMNGQELSVDGAGNGCILTEGNCELNIKASSVVLKNCSTCIDTRGGSSVKIETTQFDCVANKDGVSSVGNSMVDVTVVSSNMTDDTVIPSNSQMAQEMSDESIIGSGNGNILIIAGEDGADLRGNSEVKLKAHDESEDQDMSGNNGGDITIEGVTNGIIAVGNSHAEIEGGTCSITPDNTTKGNSEINENCNGEEITSQHGNGNGNKPEMNDN